MRDLCISSTVEADDERTRAGGTEGRADERRKRCVKASREVAADVEGDKVASARSESVSEGSVGEEGDESSGRFRLKLKQMVWRMRRSMPIRCGRCASCVCSGQCQCAHARWRERSPGSRDIALP